MHGLYTIIDPDFCRGRDPVQVAYEILSAGGKILQLRMKHASTTSRVELARQVLALKSQFQFILIINDDLDAAIESGADGLHLGQQDLPVLEARKRWKGVLGVSTHSTDDILVANTLPVDYIGFGAIYATATKGPTHPVQGLQKLKEAVRISTHPVVAIGGITASRVAEVQSTGAPAYAVLSAITFSSDIEASVRSFIRQ